MLMKPFSSEKLPIRKLPPRPPKPLGASVMPQGETTLFAKLPVTNRFTKLPSRLKMSTIPMPRGAAWNGDHQWSGLRKRSAGPRVKCRVAGALVRNPEWARGAEAHSPGIDEVRIDVCRGGKALADKETIVVGRQVDLLNGLAE